MTDIIFAVGTYKEYRLNGKETIRINVSDPNIIDRIYAFGAKVEKLQEKYGDVFTPENVGPIDKEIRALIDETINCPGACDKAFGEVSCLSVVDGQPIYMGFLHALTEQLKKDIKAVAADEKIKLDETELNNKKTQKYLKKDDMFNVSQLTPEEKRELFRKLTGAET